MKSYNQFWDGVIRSRSAEELEELDEQPKEVGNFSFERYRQDFPTQNGWNIYHVKKDMGVSYSLIGFTENPRKMQNGTLSPGKLFIHDRTYRPPKRAMLGGSRPASGGRPVHVANIVSSKGQKSRGSKPVITYSGPGDMLKAIAAWLNSNTRVWSHRMGM